MKSRSSRTSSITEFSHVAAGKSNYLQNNIIYQATERSNRNQGKYIELTKSYFFNINYNLAAKTQTS